MRKNNWLLSVLFLAAAAASTDIAAEENVVRGQVAPQSQGVLFVTPLLSEAEQAEYRASIRTAKDEREKERIRSAHYELMKARAKERGYALPENRPAAAGEEGNAFGPRLTSEEDRALQRARVRGGGSDPAGGAARQVRREPAVEMAVPIRPERVAENGGGAGGVKPDDGVKPVAPSPRSAPPAAPTMGAVVLPGMDTIFGPQLMTEEEKAAYRARLRHAKSDEERQAIRAERDQQMSLRAKEKGMTPPR